VDSLRAHGRSARCQPARPAARLVADAEPEAALWLIEAVPTWLRVRIDLALAARAEVGESVTVAENARDQIVAFRTHVVRHRPDLAGDWLGLPDRALAARLDALGELIESIGRRGPNEGA
jgi:hypothetical protein